MLDVHGHIEFGLDVCTITSLWFRFKLVFFVFLVAVLNSQVDPEVGFEGKR